MEYLEAIFIDGLKKFGGEIVAAVLFAVVLWSFPKFRKFVRGERKSELDEERIEAEAQRLAEERRKLEAQKQAEARRQKEVLEYAEEIQRQLKEAQRQAEYAQRKLEAARSQGEVAETRTQANEAVRKLQEAQHKAENITKQEIFYESNKSRYLQNFANLKAVFVRLLTAAGVCLGIPAGYLGILFVLIKLIGVFDAMMRSRSFLAMLFAIIIGLPVSFIALILVIPVYIINGIYYLIMGNSLFIMAWMDSWVSWK